MLLMLLIGAGTQAPIIDGVRAYASISFAVVNSAALTLALTTNATATEE